LVNPALCKLEAGCPELEDTTNTKWTSSCEMTKPEATITETTIQLTTVNTLHEKDFIYILQLID
jgi:hypothetical protein